MKITIPKNVGKVRVAITRGNKFSVWNGKQGEDEFSITCRTRKEVEDLVKLINAKRHDGEVDVG